MTRLGSLNPDPTEPLGLSVRRSDGPGAYQGLPCDALEFSSRGDRVVGQLVLPEGPGPHPVVLLAHGLTASRNDGVMDAIGARWVREGAAVAAIDFPLHGDRASTKMTERLLAGRAGALGAGFADTTSEMLWLEFTRQCVLDLRRFIDVLERLDSVDANRLAYVGFSLGGIVGAATCGLDPRPRGAALAIAGAGPEGSVLDPTAMVAQIAPRPVLLVNATNDEIIPRAHTERLYAAAAEPKSIEWFEAGHLDLPGAAMKSIWNFVRTLLEIPAG